MSQTVDAFMHRMSLGETCPHCRTEMAIGAEVCTGCGAERHTGASGIETGVAFKMAALVVLACTVTFIDFGYSLLLAVLAGVIAATITTIKQQDAVRWVRVRHTQ